MPSRRHGSQTRERILDAASQAFRETGFAATGIDAVMARAGLTHGGFYAHFTSKADLLQATISATAENLARNQVFAQVAHLRGRELLTASIDTYLSRWHRDHPELGCSLPTLGAELPRLGGELKGSMAQPVCGLAAILAEHFPPPHETARGRAQAFVALLVGGVVTARALPDDQADDWLASCRLAATAMIHAPGQPS